MKIGGLTIKRGCRLKLELFLIIVLAVLFSLSYQVSAAEDQYKPYLHKANVPEHPKVKLYGSYQTNLFPGAATYTYPIEVPKGTNDLQPSISISYNSQSVKQRPGILGAGWNLNLDYVQRFINGTVANTSDDFFKLNFMGSSYELVYDNSDGYYHTKTETFIRIQNLTNASNSFGTYWLITTKDGAQFRFGFTNTSELNSNIGYNYTTRWSLDRITDTYGNTITYAYLENPFANDTGAVYLSQISYNNEGKRKIIFIYENSTRPDNRLITDNGNLLSESRRLARINITYDNVLVRAYMFNYIILTPAATSLSRISFLGSREGILHNVSFDYYDSKTTYERQNISWVSPVLFTNEDTKDYGIRTVDVNNDGFIDIIKGRSTDEDRRVWINEKNGSWRLTTDSFTLTNYITKAQDKDNGIRFLDVNNDGLIDYLQSLDEGNFKLVYINNGSNWTLNSSWNIPVYFVDRNLSNGVQFADFNGDGKIDIVQAYDALPDKKIYLHNGSGWVLSNWTFPTTLNGEHGEDTGARIEDINGDGLPDIFESSSTYNRAWLNTGSGWLNFSVNIPVLFTSVANPDEGVRFADINGDGLVDILQDYKKGATIVEKAWLNNGSGWMQNDSWKSPEYFASEGNNIGRRIADINGDGQADLLIGYSNGTITSNFTWIKNSSTSYLLRTVTNELGGTITLTYDNSTYYNNTGSDAVSDIGFNVFVVKTVLANNSLNGSFNTIGLTSYKYYNGFFDFKVQEFRGFAQVNETLPDNNTISHYFYQDDALKGKEYRTEVYNSSGAIYSKTETGFNYSNHSSVYYKIFTTSQASYTYDGNPNNPKITNISFSYDNYSNVIDKRYYGDISVSGDEKLEHYDYVYNTTNYIVGKVSWYRLYAADNGTVVKDSKFSYDGQLYGRNPQRGSLTQIENWLNTSQNQIIQYEYDNFGNKIKEIDPLGRVTQTIYDTTFTYPVRTLNPLSHATDYEYDFGTGNILKRTRNSLIYSYYYDQFGRVVKEVEPYDSFDLPTKSYTYNFDGSAPESILVKQKTTSNKSLNTIFFYDGFANVAQVKRSSYDGNQIVKNLFYDGQGRVISEQNPYFNATKPDFVSSSDGVNRTFYIYDPLNRVTRVIGPDGTAIIIDFNHWVITAYDQNNHRKQYLLDSYDRISNVVEYNWDDIVRKDEVYNTSYYYDTTDNLIYINDSLGNEFRFRYDSLGRKIQLDDPDIGTYTYKYDLAGNLVQQNGGGGNLITGDGYYREYNELNQLIRARNGSNSTGNILEEYTYDPNGDRIKIKRYDAANTTVYTPYREWTRIINISGTYDLTYIYDGSTLVARINPDGNKSYFHDDHLGSTSLITNQSGSIFEQTFFEPYGSVEEGGTAEDKLYTGQFSDDIYCQYYYGARFYSPCNAMFIQPDSIIQNAYNPQLLNHYSYVKNNPYVFVDPNGKEVKVAFRDVRLAPGIFSHAYIILNPDNPEDFKAPYNTGFTLGGQPSSVMGGKLTLEMNQKRDYNPGSSIIEEFTIPSPEGMTDTEFIKQIIGLYENYKYYSFQLYYEEFGDNSNVAAYNLLLGSGVDQNVLNNEIKPTVTAPGWGKNNLRISTYTFRVPISIDYNNGQIIGGNLGNIRMSPGFASKVNEIERGRGRRTWVDSDGWTHSGPCKSFGSGGCPS